MEGVRMFHISGILLHLLLLVSRIDALPYTHNRSTTAKAVTHANSEKYEFSVDDNSPHSGNKTHSKKEQQRELHLITNGMLPENEAYDANLPAHSGNMTETQVDETVNIEVDEAEENQTRANSSVVATLDESKGQNDTRVYTPRPIQRIEIKHGLVIDQIIKRTRRGKEYKVDYNESREREGSIIKKRANTRTLRSKHTDKHKNRKSKIQKQNRMLKMRPNSIDYKSVKMPVKPTEVAPCDDNNHDVKDDLEVEEAPDLLEEAPIKLLQTAIKKRIDNTEIESKSNVLIPQSNPEDKDILEKLPSEDYVQRLQDLKTEEEDDTGDLVFPTIPYVQTRKTTEIPADLVTAEVLKHKDCWVYAIKSEDGFSPSCREDGSYSAKQCHNGRCWCVTENGQPLVKDPNHRYSYSLDGLTLLCEAQL